MKLWSGTVALGAGAVGEGVEEGDGLGHAVGAIGLHGAAHVADGHRRVGRVLVREPVVVRREEAPMRGQQNSCYIRCAL